jgi:hypothetical protein
MDAKTQGKQQNCMWLDHIGVSASAAWFTLYSLAETLAVGGKRVISYFRVK